MSFKMIRLLLDHTISCPHRALLMLNGRYRSLHIVAVQFRNLWKVIRRPYSNMVSHGILGDLKQFRKICDIEADLSDLFKTLQVQRNTDTGISYYRADFEIAIFFGGTTLQGRLRWYTGVSANVRS